MPIYFDTSYTQFTGAPSLESHGLHSATLVSSWGLFDEPDTSKISFEKCRYAANHPTFWLGRESDMIVLDCETIDLHCEDLPLRDHNHDQLIEAVRIYREAHPGCAIGYYSELPQGNFYGGLYKTGDPIWSHYKAYYEQWVRNNKHPLTNLDDATLGRTKNGLCSVVDRVFPSCYLPLLGDINADRAFDLWTASHDENVRQAVQYQKPIIVYLCPQFENTATYLPAGMFGRMIGHSLRNPSVDGVCVYQSVVPGTPFDASSDWWKETLTIVESHT